MPWYVYIAYCADGSLYTGVAKDVGERIVQHNSGRGAKYTRSRRPLELAYVEPREDRSSALRREAEIKRLSRSNKLALIFSG